MTTFGSPEFQELIVNKNYTIIENAVGHDNTPDRIPVSRHRVITTNEFMKSLYDKFIMKTTELIPQNCRYIEHIENGKIVVVEETPQIRTILTTIDLSNNYAELTTKGVVKEYGYENFFDKYKKSSGSIYKFTLAFPYLVFVIRFTNNNEFALGRVFFRKKSLLGLGELLYKAPLYNINIDQSLCIGRDDQPVPITNISLGIKNVIDRFWMATFNSDYIANIHEYAKTGNILANFFEWEYYTKVNPMFIYSVDLIPHQVTLNQVIKNMKGTSSNGEENSSRSLYSFASLIKAITTPIATGTVIKDPVYKQDTELLDNITSGILTNSGTIEVGERFKLASKEYVVVSFMGLPESGPTHIKLFNVDLKEEKIFTLTNKLKEEISKSIFEYYLLESIEINGIILKPSDIILLKRLDTLNIHKKIDHIRRNIDGIPEIKIGNEYVTPQILQKCFVEKINIDQIYLRGDQLVKNFPVCLIKNIIPSIPIAYAEDQTYHEFSVVDGNICLEFTLSKHCKTLSGQNNYIMSLNNFKDTENCIDNPKPNTLLKTTDVNVLPPIFRYFRNICSTKYSLSTKDSSSVKYIPKKYFVLHNNDPIQSCYIEKDLVKYIIQNDTLSLKSFDIDIEYKIGDRVIVADWKNPDKLLVPRTITGFKTNTLENSETEISILLIDKKDNIAIIPFIKKGKIEAGKVRKIVNEWNGVRTGTKIVVSAKNKVYMFPKKDVNIIVGFLTDTGTPEPQVLCSNGLTLWFSDLEKFELIPTTSSKWASLDHVPIIDQYNIPIQPGDIVQGNGSYGVDDFIIFKHSESKNLRALILSYFQQYTESINVTQNFRYSVTLDCIPAPRIQLKDQEHLGFIPAYPNLFGGIIPNQISALTFINDPRSISI